MLCEIKEMQYVDSNGRLAVAHELLGSTDCGLFTMFRYRKRLVNGSAEDDGIAYLYAPNDLTMRHWTQPADTEEEAKCQTLAALSREVAEAEHHLERVRKLKEELCNDLI